MRARSIRNLMPLGGLLLALGGCASVVVPTEQIELTRNAVNRAVAADATQYAPVEMRAAQDKLNAMERAMGQQDMAQVRTLAEQAEADASFAERKAQASKAQAQLSAAREDIEVLKREMLEAPDTLPAVTAE